MNIIVNDLLTHYELTGKGKLVVLLHGWGDSARGLAGLQVHLARQFQVLAIDLPGFGTTQAPTTIWDLDNYAAFVADVLQKLDCKVYAIVGHSNGGAIAIRGLSLGSLKADKLVLMAAAGIRNRRHVQRLALKVVAKTGNLATLWLPERQRQNLRKSLYGTVGSDMLVVPELQATFKKSVRQDVQVDAAKLKLPTLLIYADHDRAVPLADGRKYHQLIKNSKLEIITDAGHFLHVEQPAAVNKLVEDFLK